MGLTEKLEEIKKEVRALLYEDIGCTLFVGSTESPNPRYMNKNYGIDKGKEEILKRLQENDIDVTKFDILIEISSKMVKPWRMGFLIKIEITEKEVPQNA